MCVPNARVWLFWKVLSIVWLLQVLTRSSWHVYIVWQTCYRLTFHTLLTTHKKIPTLSAGRQTSNWNQAGVSGACSGPVRAPSECWLYVSLFATVLFVDCGDYGEQMFSLSCLLTHKSWKRLGPCLYTLCLSSCSCIPVCVGPVYCCFTLKEITDVSKNLVFTTTSLPPPLKEPQTLRL